MENHLKDILKDQYEEFSKALCNKDVKALYMNSLKGADDLLDQRYITPHPVVKKGYIYDDSKYTPGKLPYFLQGLYYIQEPSAMLVAPLLDIQSDDYVLDMCAAPGGKACYAAMKLGEEGLLIANDIHPARSKILSENIERFGSKNTIVTNTDPLRFVGLLDGFFDKIILDAPCSGEGMLRKTDLAKETWSLQKVEECSYIQKKLIEAAYKLLKPGGKLIYSTCTYEIKENEDIVRYALEKFNFKLLSLPHSHGMDEGIDMPEVIRTYPHHYNGEGQFIALLEKTGVEEKSTYKPQLPSISKKRMQILQSFWKDTLNIPMPKYLVENKGHIYAIKPQFPDLGKIRILRNGLYLGEVRKSYFIPSYSLAITLNKEDVKRYYDYPVNSDEVRKFIHGETLPSTGNKGYGVLFVDGYALSFYKESNQVKNLLPKGVRR